MENIEKSKRQIVYDVSIKEAHGQIEMLQKVSIFKMRNTEKLTENDR